MPSVSNHLSEGMGHQTLSAATNITQAWHRPAAIGIHSSKIQTIPMYLCLCLHPVQHASIWARHKARCLIPLCNHPCCCSSGAWTPRAPSCTIWVVPHDLLSPIDSVPSWIQYWYNHAWKTCIIRIIIPCNPHRTLYHHETVWLSFASTIWD